MGVRSSLGRAVSVLRANPSLFVAAFGYSLLATVVSSATFLGGDVGVVGQVSNVVVGVLVFPFFLGGIVGMAHEADRSGGVSLRTLVEHGREHFLSVLAGVVVVGAVTIVVGVVMYIGVILLVVFGVLTASAGGAAGLSVPPALLAALAVAGVVAIAVTLLPVFVFQFYPGAVVLDGRGVVGGVKRAVSVLRGNLLSALGFDAVVLAVGLVTSSVGYLVVFAALGGGPRALVGQFTATTAAGALSLPPEVVLAYGAFSLVVGTVTSAFQWTLYAVLYDDLTAGGAGSRGPASRGVDAGRSPMTDD